jgi:toxin ParE1/3/4
MSNLVALTDDAARDLDELYAHSHLHDEAGQADLLLDRIQTVFRSLSESVGMGSFPLELLALGIREYREVLIDRYRILYRSIDDRVCVLMIVDSRRDIQLSLARRLLEP